MMKRKQPSKPYWEMTTAELTAATKESDRELPPSKFRPLTKAERERWERASAGPSRSIYIHAQKRKKVTVELDERVLDRSTKVAKRRRMTVSDLISRSLRHTLEFAD